LWINETPKIGILGKNGFGCDGNNGLPIVAKNEVQKKNFKMITRW